MLKNGCSNSAYWTNSHALWGWGWGRYFFTGIAKLNNQSLFPKEVLSKPMRMHVLFEITGPLFYMLAITLTPLSSATVILQATLVVVVAGAALVLDSGFIVIAGLFILWQSKQMKTSTQASIGSHIFRS
jgi:hypothetical protein